MGNTYSGGSTLVRLGEEGTSWTSVDQADNRAKSKTRRLRERTPTKKEIELEVQREQLAEDQLLRSFISQCAAAYIGRSLTATEPTAPRIFRKWIQQAGGNIGWLESDRRHQGIFHKAFCRLRKTDVPFEKVWGPAG